MCGICTALSTSFSWIHSEFLFKFWTNFCCKQTLSDWTNVLTLDLLKLEQTVRAFVSTFTWHYLSYCLNYRHTLWRGLTLNPNLTLNRPRNNCLDNTGAKEIWTKGLINACVLYKILVATSQFYNKRQFVQHLNYIVN